VSDPLGPVVAKSGVGAALKGAPWVVRKVKERLGVTDAPNPTFGAPRTIALPNDARPLMHVWQHLPLTNAQRPERRLLRWRVQERTRSLEVRRVHLEVTGQALAEPLVKTAFAVIDGSEPYFDAFSVHMGDRYFVPIFAAIPEPVPAWWKPGVRIRPGTYVTGSDFFRWPETAASMRLASGDYDVWIRVQHDDGELISDTVPLHVP
jgi:hypothetical protein